MSANEIAVAEPAATAPDAAPESSIVNSSESPTSSTSTISSCTTLAQTIALKERLSDDLPACDLQWTLFVAAAQCFRYDSTLSPYPSRFAWPPSTVHDNRTANGDRFDIETILRLIEAVPALRTIDWLMGGDRDLMTNVVDLLHWVLCVHGRETVRLERVPLTSHAEVMGRIQCSQVTVRPMHIFQVLAQRDGGEERFQALRQRDDNETERQTMFGFHGSRLENFHSISTHGLQQHLCKQSLFGDGIYLSTEMHVSLPFSSVGGAWAETELGTDLSCMAICEFVDHEAHLKRRVADGRDSLFPDKYFVITNNDIVRVRYLIVFGKRCKRPNPVAVPPPHLAAIPSQLLQQPQQVDHQRQQIGVPRRRGGLWTLLNNNKGECLLLGYALMLLFVGFITSRTGVYWRERFWEHMDSWLSEPEDQHLHWLRPSSSSVGGESSTNNGGEGAGTGGRSWNPSPEL